MKRSGFKSQGKLLERKTPLRSSAGIKPKEPKAEPKRRTRKCALASCRQPFEPRSMTHKTCSPECAQAYVELEKDRQARRERQEGLAKLKRRADYFKEAQAALNAWIRLVRDRDKPCISCGRFHQGQNHAGHYLARGSHPHMALLESNIHLQCAPCNTHLSGNQIMFRRGLVDRYGLDYVEALESDQAERKYTIPDLQAIKAHYRQLVREATKSP